MSKDEKDIEALIQAKGLTRPRLTPACIDAAICAESYTTLPSGKVMVCELTLRNGFTVRGEAAVVSKANFDEEVGRKISRENARNKVWELEGYLLQQRLHDLATDAGSFDELVGRFLTWPVPADVYPDGTPGQPGRTGTNLLSAEQAQQMLSHVLGRAWCASELRGLIAELLDTELGELASAGSHAPVEDILGRMKRALGR